MKRSPETIQRPAGSFTPSGFEEQIQATAKNYPRGSAIELSGSHEGQSGTVIGYDLKPNDASYSATGELKGVEESDPNAELVPVLIVKPDGSENIRLLVREDGVVLAGFGVSKKGERLDPADYQYVKKPPKGGFDY